MHWMRVRNKSLHWHHHSLLASWTRRHWTISQKKKKQCLSILSSVHQLKPITQPWKQWGVKLSSATGGQLLTLISRRLLADIDCSPHSFGKKKYCQFYRRRLLKRSQIIILEETIGHVNMHFNYFSLFSRFCFKLSLAHIVIIIFVSLHFTLSLSNTYTGKTHTRIYTHIKSWTPQITLISNLLVFEALMVQGYWFHSAAALSGHLQWWGKTMAAKSALAFIRRLSGGNQLVRVYWNLINIWCRLMGRTTGEFVLVLPAGQSGRW